MRYQDDKAIEPPKRTEWTIVPATLDDVDGVVNASWAAADLVHPYALGPAQIKGYLDQWIVAKHPVTGTVTGYMHYLRVKEGDPESYANVIAYLQHVKIVPDDIVSAFTSQGSKAVFIGQSMGPSGTGIQKLVVDYLKEMEGVEEIWHGLSIVSPLFDYYRDRCGIDWQNEYSFFNPFKGAYSTFKLGRWYKDAS